MYTVAEDSDDDHYADLVRTLCFLGGEELADGFSADLRHFRRALMNADAGPGLDGARSAKQQIEATLRQVMVRTERLASTPDRGGMLTENQSARAVLSADDVRSFLTLDRLTRLIDGGPVIDFWKDSAYPLNFMEDYKLAQSFRGAVEGRSPRELIDLLSNYDGLLRWEDVAAYSEIDPANARLRTLISDVVDGGAWRLAWLPPALPYYELEPPWDATDRGGFTKRLVFSAWKVVPKVIAALVSYEVERRMMTAGGRDVRNTTESHERFRPLLQVTRSGGRLTGMPVFALLYPSPALAELGDPREVAATMGAAAGPINAAALTAVVRRRVEEALEPLLADASQGGQVDERWYWAAPLLLDRLSDRGGWNADWWEDEQLATRWLSADEAGEPAAAGWQAHVDQARDLIQGRLPALGRPPPDLAEVVSELAVAGPAIAALRALARLGVTDTLGNVELRDTAAYIAWGFRSLFNQPEVTSYLRSTAGEESRREDTYWRLVLRYCVSGCLQTVLDEYLHMLNEESGVAGASPERVLETVSEAVRDAMAIRNANYAVDEVLLDNGTIELARHHMRGRFALRFGDERGEDARTAQRQTTIRAAFNSPFWPFVLATTSVGQEGLDFHPYCHAVVHWNLPSNPVDLEQREGRVHRYKGHAVRKNVAAAHRAAAFGTDRDPWSAMFMAASGDREAGLSEVVPYWVYAVPGGAQIERHVPALPLSRDAVRLEALKRSLAVYRLVFGQPRQDDLVAYLQSRFSEDTIRRLLDELRIDLSPRPSHLSQASR